MFYSSILSNFNKKLNEIQLTNSNFLDQANLGYILCTKALDFLRKTIEKNSFKNLNEEIHFFKNVKVEPMRHLIHYTEIRSCELRMPKIGISNQMKYLDTQIDKVNTFFGRHTEFLLYMEQGYTHFDEHYFTREHIDHTSIVKSYPYYKDPSFNTSHDETWARIKGLGLYVNYLKVKKELLENEGVHKNNSEIIWTGPYSAFVEMMYGCQAMGYFNNGNISTNQIIGSFSDFLNIKRGNSSRTYYEIKARKGSRIKFFDETGHRLLEKMREEDDLDK